MNRKKFFRILIFFFITCANSACVVPVVIKNTPDTTDYFYKAEQHYTKEEYKQAKYFYDLFIRESNESYLKEQAYYKLGKIYFEDENYNKALLNFRKIIYRYTESQLLPDARYYASRCIYLLKDYKRALSALNEYQKDFPNSRHDPEIRIMLTEAYREIGEYIKSQDMANSILILYPNTEYKYQTLYQLAETEIFLNEVDSALLHYRQALKGDLSSFFQLKIQKALINAFLSKGDNLEAITLIASMINQGIKEDGENQEHFYTKLNDIIENKLTINELRIVVAKFSNSFPADLAMLEIGDRFYREGENYDASLWWRRFVQTFPDHEKTQIVLLELLELFSSRVIDEIKIGCIAPITEQLASYGEKMVRGVKVAIEEYNQVHEKKATLVLVDSKGKPNFARQGVDVLTNQEDVFAIIGPLVSESVKLAAELAEQLQVPLITPIAGSDGICQIGRFIFRNALTSDHQTSALANYAIDQLGLIDFGILFPYDPIGQKSMILFADHIEELGGDVPIIEFFDQEDTDFKHQILRIHQINPEALFVPSDYNKAVLIAPQIPFYKPEEDEEILEESSVSEGGSMADLAAVEIEDKNKLADDDKENETEDIIQLFGTDGWYDPLLIQQGEKYVDGTICSVGFFPYSETQEVKNFVYAYAEKYHETPGLISAQSYEATRIILHIIDSGAITREEIRQGLTQVENYKGICGTIGFDPSGESKKEVTLLKVKRKSFIQIYP